MTDAELYAIQEIASALLELKPGEEIPIFLKRADRANTFGRVVFNLVQDYRALRIENDKLQRKLDQVKLDISLLSGDECKIQK